MDSVGNRFVIKRSRARVWMVINSEQLDGGWRRGEGSGANSERRRDFDGSKCNSDLIGTALGRANVARVMRPTSELIRRCMDGVDDGLLG